MTYETLSREEAGGVLRKIEDWIIKHIPAQRRKINTLKKSLHDNGNSMSRRWDDLPSETRDRLKDQAFIMGTVNMHKREGDGSHVDH